MSHSQEEYRKFSVERPEIRRLHSSLKINSGHMAGSQSLSQDTYKEMQVISFLLLVIALVWILKEYWIEYIITSLAVIFLKKNLSFEHFILIRNASHCC